MNDNGLLGCSGRTDVGPRIYGGASGMWVCLAIKIVERPTIDIARMALNAAVRSREIGLLGVGTSNHRVKENRCLVGD